MKRTERWQLFQCARNSMRAMHLFNATDFSVRDLLDREHFLFSLLMCQRHISGRVQALPVTLSSGQNLFLSMMVAFVLSLASSRLWEALVIQMAWVNSNPLWGALYCHLRRRPSQKHSVLFIRGTMKVAIWCPLDFWKIAICLSLICPLIFTHY